jgi:hypothetical protein
MEKRRSSWRLGNMACMDATLTVYTADGCCLCDEARAELDGLAPALGLDVTWVYIDGDAELEAQWREQIPAGVLGGRKVFKYRVDADQLRRRVAAMGISG